jgi:hypothetical protein
MGARPRSLRSEEVRVDDEQGHDLAPPRRVEERRVIRDAQIFSTKPNERSHRYLERMRRASRTRYRSRSIESEKIDGARSSPLDAIARRGHPTSVGAQASALELRRSSFGADLAKELLKESVHVVGLSSAHDAIGANARRALVDLGARDLEARADGVGLGGAQPSVVDEPLEVLMRLSLARSDERAKAIGAHRVVRIAALVDVGPIQWDRRAWRRRRGTQRGREKDDDDSDHGTTPISRAACDAARVAQNSRREGDPIARGH